MKPMPTVVAISYGGDYMTTKSKPSTYRIGRRVRTRPVSVPVSCFAAIVAALAFPNSGVLASEVEFLNIDALTASADTIVHADVASAKSEWNAAHDQIWTNITLQVRQMLKGDTTKKAISFRQLGGTVGDLTLTVVGLPSFAAGEEIVVFLHKALASQDFGYWVQGKWIATTDEDTNQKVFQQELAGLESETGDQKQEKLVLDDLLARITKAVALQKSQSEKDAKKETKKE